MELTDKAQEILERLWIHEREQGQGGLPAPGDADLQSEAIRELQDAGLVVLQNERLALTLLGEPEGLSAVRRHRLAERLLADVLDAGEALMEDSACQFEHLLHRELEQRVCTLLGHPNVCPHGRPIPPGDCCQKATQRRGQPLVGPLSGLKPGQTATIAYLSTQDPKEMQKLMSMGILPGMPVELTQDFPSYVFQLHYSQFAVDKELAGRIYVRIRE